MERKTLAMGIGFAAAGAAGVGLGMLVKSRRQRARAEDRPRKMAASFSGDIRGGEPGAGADLGRWGTSTGVGASVERMRNADRGEPLPTPIADAPRSATRMAPGIPVGSGEGIDRALGQPDSNIGGGVAGDTTVDDRQERDKRGEERVRNDDATRTTL